jgi:hypothetical protein
MTRGDARSSDATASIPRVNTVPIAASAGEFIESAEQHQTLSSFSDSETADETVYHETTEKPVLVSSPTLLHPRAHPQFAAMMDADAREFIERNRDIATPHVSGVSGTYNTALYDLTFAKITGCQIGGRHPNPLRDADARYALKLYSDYAGYDLSACASLNPLTWLLVAADERSIADPYGPLTPAEHLAAWLTAKREDLLPSRDSVPNTALVAAAIDLGLIERDQLIATDVLIPDNGIITLDGALPFAVYNETIRRFPDQYSVAPGRRQPVTEDAMQLQDVTRANFTQMFAQRFLTKQPRKFQTPLKSPRDSVSAVWALHECVRKANDIAAISATDPLRAPKQAIADAIEGVRKQSTTWYPGARSRPQLYVGARLTDAGRALALMHGIDIDDWQ